jgi:hypothetical protein
MSEHGDHRRGGPIAEDAGFRAWMAGRASALAGRSQRLLNTCSVSMAKLKSPLVAK